MPEIVSHGIWTRGPDGTHGGVMRFMTFAHADGRDWYAHAHEHLADPSTVKVLVRDGRAVMVERDGTRIVPPGEVLEVPDGVPVERDWFWRDGSFVPPLPETDDAVAKVRAFLAANPDVRAILG